jgi:hypothetical protein
MRATRFSQLLAKAMRSDSNATATVPLTAQAVTGQTANLVEIKDASGNVITSVGPTGFFNGTRLNTNPTPKTIVDGSATSLFEVAIAQGAMAGGLMGFTVEASDGTDHQALSGLVSYSAVNKAGTLTLTITQLSTVEAKAVSSGTLTLAWTFVTGTGKGTVKLQPTGSLTETTYRITYTVFPMAGAITIL